MRARLAGYGIDSSRAQLLEVGCGHWYPYATLFRSVGVRVVGVDLQPLVPRFPAWARYRQLARTRGAAPAVRRAAGDAIHRLAFYGPLGRAAGVSVKLRGVRLVRMDAGRLGFGDASFDYVFSSACFEHLSDVPGVVREIRRVLRPSGVAEVEIHLFASMTGGHDPELFDHRPPPPGFPLWRHLLDPAWRPPVYLNRWHEWQFRDALAAEFRIEDVRLTSDHGRDYLTPQLLERLEPTFTHEELVRESVLFILRPR